MKGTSELGSFLRARRAAVAPTQAGLPTDEDRRVPGLRRDEVALLAGVSSDYYTRLEQGRERHPSHQVLGAISRALQLDPHLFGHLLHLAAPTSVVPASPSQSEVSDELHMLLAKFHDTAAMVVSPALDILAANSVFDALYSGFDSTDNIAQMVFLDPAAHDFYEDWDLAANTCVQNLRAVSAPFPDDPRVAHIVGTLAVRSPAFAQLWARYELRPRVNQTKNFNHPDIGLVTLKFQAFATAAPGQHLWTYMAVPGTPSDAKMALLAAMNPVDP